MKRIFLTGLFASLIAVACFAQKPYKVVFYNFENLFDTLEKNCLRPYIHLSP